MSFVDACAQTQCYPVPWQCLVISKTHCDMMHVAGFVEMDQSSNINLETQFPCGRRSNRLGCELIAFRSGTLSPTSPSISSRWEPRFTTWLSRKMAPTERDHHSHVQRCFDGGLTAPLFVHSSIRSSTCLSRPLPAVRIFYSRIYVDGLI